MAWHPLVYANAFVHDNNISILTVFSVENPDGGTAQNSVFVLEEDLNKQSCRLGREGKGGGERDERDLASRLRETANVTLPFFVSRKIVRTFWL